MHIADTLSRAVYPGSCGVGSPDREEIFLTDTEKEIEQINMFETVPIKKSSMEELQAATRDDADMLTLMSVIQAGWPEERHRLPLCVQPFFPFKEELSTQNGVIFKGERVVVPEGQREKILHLLHQAHTGVQGCLRRARETVYWPGLTKDIEQLVGLCDTCQTYQKSQTREPMITHPIPEHPWQMVGCDLMDYAGHAYLVTVDYYSDFFEVDRLSDKTAEAVIAKLKPHFARHGIPDRLISDGGPPFSSKKFQQFEEQWQFHHIFSSPYYPQSNGKAENAVKQAKALMKKALHSNSDPYLGLLELRNTPSESMGTSPSQRLFSRRTKTKLPTSKRLLKPRTCENVQKKLIDRKAKQQQYYNRGTLELDRPTLKPGQVVRVKMGGKWTKAQVQAQVDVRSYKIRTEDGNEYRRNRRDIRKTMHTTPVATGDKQNLAKRLNDMQLSVAGGGAKTDPVRSKRGDSEIQQTQTQTQTQTAPLPQIEQGRHQCEARQKTPISFQSRRQNTVDQNGPHTPKQMQNTQDQCMHTPKQIQNNHQQCTHTSRSGRISKRPAYLKDYEN
jgi:hypothetical protein